MKGDCRAYAPSPIPARYIPLWLSRPLKLMRLYNVKLISTDNSGTKRSTGDPRVSKRPDFLGLFRSPKINWIFLCLYFCFFWIYGYISGTKRVTGDPQVSKRPDFRGLFRFPKSKWIFGVLYFIIFWITGHISGTKRATRDLRVSKRPNFWGLFRFLKNWILLFLNFCIFVFLMVLVVAFRKYIMGHDMMHRSVLIRPGDPRNDVVIG